jgi:hypothetical protein
MNGADKASPLWGGLILFGAGAVLKLLVPIRLIAVLPIWEREGA